MSGVGKALAINTDFSVPAIVHASKLPWIPSPMPGVDRRMLDRLGDEVARATSIVRYARGSSFSPHVHTGGEEFLVLEGVFQDEHGDFPAGSYIRNPPESSHTPRSAPGCTIFVKLWQFDPSDRVEVRIDTNTREFESVPGSSDIRIMPLFKDRREDVRLEEWRSGATVDLVALNGLEVLVLGGGFVADGETFEVSSWLRLPKNGAKRVEVGEAGARVWTKRGHLSVPPRAPDTA